MARPTDIAVDIWSSARRALIVAGRNPEHDEEAVTFTARAIAAERARWQPAVTYFNRYCLDEADAVENCICGQAQHDDAKAFGAVVRQGVE